MVPQQVLATGMHERIALSADGRLCASVHRDLVHLWDTETGALLRVMKPPGTGLYGAALAFPPDGGMLHAVRYDLTVTTFDLASGDMRYATPGRDFGFSAGAFSADGHFLFVGEMTGRLLRFDVRAGKVDRVFDGSDASKAPAFDPAKLSDAFVLSLALSARGDVGLVSRKAGPVEVWDTERGRKRFSLGKTGLPGAPMALSEDGARALVRTDPKNAFELWDLRNGKLVRSFSGAPAEAFAVLPDGRRALVSARGALRLVSLDDDKTAWTTSLAAGSAMAVSADGLRVLVGSTGNLEVRDVEDGALRRSFTSDKPTVSAAVGGVAFSKGGDQALTTFEFASTAWDLGSLGRSSTSRVPEKPSLPGATKPAATSADGRLGAFIVGKRDPAVKDPFILPPQDIRVVDLVTGQTQSELSVDASYIKTVVFSPDGARVACGSMCRAKRCGGGHFKIFDAKTGALQKDVEQTGATVDALAFSPDGKRLAVGGGARTLDIVDVETGKTEKRLGGTFWWVSSVAFSPDGRFLLSTGPDGMTRMNRLDGDAAVTFVTAGDEWLVYGDDGLFDASRRGGALAAAVKGLSAYRIDQLAVRNNRPDLLLERMGLGTPAIVAHYRARHERRLKKLGLSEDRLVAALGKAPSARITSVTSDGAWATIELDLEAEGADLARYGVFVDDVPLFGPLGKTISGKKAHVTEKIALSAGKNKIEASVLDASGIESLRVYRVLERNEKPKRDLHYIAFGVSTYKNPKYNLGYPHKDVLDLGEVLRAGEGVFERVHIHAFVNEEATVENVRRAKSLVQNARIDDVVVLFIAGHGLHSRDASADYYFATHEIEPKRLAETAAPFELFEDLLASTPARKRLFLMDTCESGERDEDEPALASAKEGARGLLPRTTRELVLDLPEKPQPRPFLADRDRYIYNDLSRRTGAVVLSSSRGSEFSYELAELQNGVFTESMLVALTTVAADLDGDAMVSTDELRAYLADAVPGRTGDKQHPTVDRDNLEAHFGLPVVKNAAGIVTRKEADVRRDEPTVATRAMRQPPPPRGCGCEVLGTSGETNAPALGLFALALASMLRKSISRRPSMPGCTRRTLSRGR